MVTELMVKASEKELENLATRVFLKSLDLLGSLSKLVEYRTLTWLPSLARASFVVVLKEEYLKTEDEIAETVGLTKNTVRNILRADPQLGMYKIQHLDELTEEERKQLKVHTAGSIAKLAYKLVKEGQEAQVLLELSAATGAQVAQVCEVPWAYAVLKKSKGIHYPIESPADLKDRLSGISIKGIDGAEIVEKLTYPIRTPAHLLHEIKEYIQIRGA